MELITKSDCLKIYRLRGQIKHLTNKEYYILEQVKTYTLFTVLLIISVTDTYCFVIKNGYFLALN